MTLKTRRIIRHTLMGIALTATVASCVFVVAIATPSEYRLGFWGRLPVLDHRLLPHLSALFAGAFGAFSDRCLPFTWGACSNKWIVWKSDTLL